MMFIIQGIHFGMMKIIFKEYPSRYFYWIIILRKRVKYILAKSCLKL